MVSEIRLRYVQHLGKCVMRGSTVILKGVNVSDYKKLNWRTVCGVTQYVAPQNEPPGSLPLQGNPMVGKIF